MKNRNLKKMILSALFLVLGYVLPLFTSQIKEIGDTLLPMHIPVMLCGLVCGARYGLAVGFVLPFLRGIVFSMPPLYPNALWMALELATYGFVTGFMYGRVKNPKTGYLYFCLSVSMLLGRVVWGITKTVLLGLTGKAFTFEAFLIGGFVDAFPGIVLQFILIPFIIGVLNHLAVRSIYKKEVSK